MLIALLRWLSGYLRIRIRGYSPERFLNLCSHHGIYLWDLASVDGAYEMDISVKGFRRLRPILRKTRIRIAIRKRCGLPFFLHRYRRRKLFFAGCAGCAALIYVLSLFVWNIHIEGNRLRTDETILEFLKSRQVVHGMLVSRVDCAQIVRDIRQEYDDIIWVSASIRGSRLLIQVKENSDSVEAAESESREGKDTQEPVDIIAAADGVVEEMITRSGVPQVHVGDQVKKGDVLVAGNVPVKNDAGEIVGYQYQKADARIIARTELSYREELPLTYVEKDYTGKKRMALSVETAKRIYRLGGGNIPFSHAVRRTVQYTPRLGEHFDLPVSFGCAVTEEYEPKRKTYGNEELQSQLTGRFHKFCRNLEKKGVQILENDVKIYKESGKAVSRGTLLLLQEIGESRSVDPMTAAETDSATDQQEGNQ